jgi:uncharacterized DUF497 family protein
MRLSFDPVKNERNIQLRGLDFALVADFEWATAVMVEDLRKDYGERRFLALGRIGERLHALVFTPRANSLHVISLRKANDRELKHYEKTN